MVVAPVAESLRRLVSDQKGKQLLATRQELADALAKIQFHMPSEDLEVCFNAADMDGDGLLNEGELDVFLTSMSGRELPAGNVSDLGLSDVQVCLSRILGLLPEEHGSAAANSMMPSLEAAAKLLAPAENPNAYRVCQNAFTERGAADPLLSLARHAPSDAVRAKATEVLVWLAFGNDAAAAAIATSPFFLPALDNGLKNELYPQRLTLLQLVQAVVASHCEQVSTTVPALVHQIVPILTIHQPFQAIVEVAVDVLVSSSFHCPSYVAKAVSWPMLAAMLAEEADVDRPAWLPANPLSTLVCGLMCMNVVGELVSNESDEAARRLLIARIDGGLFIEHFKMATEAAVARREWPLGSSAFHSPSRLALIASILAQNGYANRLASTVEPLAEFVGSSNDQAAVHNALRALLGLCRADVDCLEKMLALTEFRSTVLTTMHISDAQPDATALYLFTAGVEQRFAESQVALQILQGYCYHAPSISDLAKIFIRFAPLDGELSAEQMLQALPLVPVGPAVDVRTAILGDGRPRQFNFYTYAEHIYGTPELLGLWPSLMEDSAATWKSSGTAACLPELKDLVALFDKGANGSETIDADGVLREVLPTAGLPISSTDDNVRDDLAALHCEGPFNLKEFVEWMCNFCAHVEQAEAEAGTTVASVVGEDVN
mmetsp:Transcript_8094/g.14925  ORF Transcript_8094/g.14925 Transcript_8094/m.14925 type:complete len:661 (+) Transcript_8094:71-2053(+)